MTLRRRLSLGCVSIMVGTVACTATVPPATPAPSAPPTPSTRDSHARPAGPESQSSPPDAEPGPAGPLGRELVIHTVDPALAGAVSAVASDDDGVYFGSGIADGSGADHAPDLWRVGPSSEVPELLWRNPGRQRSLAVIAADLGTVAFAEMDDTGGRDWNLWLLPEAGATPIVLDSHPGDEEVSGFLPSMTVSEGRVVWTAFDRGPAGPVSQLLLAEAPDWTPIVLEERDAARAELWLPSLRGTELVFTEVRYNAERTRDERHVYLTDVASAAAPRRLDTSGHATMPVFVNDGVVWKETDPGFNMFNWGSLVFWNRYTEELRPIPSRLQPDVNFPSAGWRFVAVVGYDSAIFEVFDVDRMSWRLIDRFDLGAGEAVSRATVGGSILAWLESDPEMAEDVVVLRWALLPPAGGDRLLDG